MVTKLESPTSTAGPCRLAAMRTKAVDLCVGNDDSIDARTSSAIADLAREDPEFGLHALAGMAAAALGIGGADVAQPDAAGNSAPQSPTLQRIHLNRRLAPTLLESPWRI